jgi:hypothetical protein
MHGLHKREWGMEMVKRIALIALVVGAIAFVIRKSGMRLADSLEGIDNG